MSLNRYVTKEHELKQEPLGPIGKYKPLRT